jgi:ABC-type phosphate/phosphonate transport system substrate-binding protein
MRLRTLVTAALLLASTALSAGPHDVAIHVTRLGGDRGSAQPYVDRLLRRLEGLTGWAAGSMKGAFVVSKKEALAYLAQAQPGFGMLEPALYFELRKSHALTPLLQVESVDLVSPKLHVVVKDAGLKTLADLAGKRLWTTLGDHPRYLQAVVLEGKLDLAGVQVKPLGQALKGLRGVLRGDCDATVLDDDQLAKARQMTGGADLRVLASSPALPSIPLVAFGGALSEAEKAALVKALSGLCGTPEGAAVCKEMHIGRFVPVDAATFSRAQAAYGE